MGATRQMRRLAKAARGGGIRPALEAFLRWLNGVTGRSACTRDVREFHESLREFGPKNFRCMTADGWLAKGGAGVVAAGRAQAALEALLRRLKGWHRQERSYEMCT